MTVRAGSSGSMTLRTVVVRGSHVGIMFNIAWLQSRMTLITGLELNRDRIMTCMAVGAVDRGACNACFNCSEYLGARTEVAEQTVIPVQGVDLCLA